MRRTVLITMLLLAVAGGISLCREAPTPTGPAIPAAGTMLLGGNSGLGGPYMDCSLAPCEAEPPAALKGDVPQDPAFWVADNRLFARHAGQTYVLQCPDDATFDGPISLRPVTDTDRDAISLALVDDTYSWNVVVRLPSMDVWMSSREPHPRPDF